MMREGRMMQKTDLAVRMVKTSPRGRNLRAAMLVKKRHPVKKPRVTTRSFSLKNHYIKTSQLLKFSSQPASRWQYNLVPMSNCDCEEGDLHDSPDHDKVCVEVMGGLEAFDKNCSEDGQDDTDEGKSNSYKRTKLKSYSH